MIYCDNKRNGAFQARSCTWSFSIFILIFFYFLFLLKMSECVKWGSVGMNAGMLLLMNRQKTHSATAV